MRGIIEFFIEFVAEPLLWSYFVEPLFVGGIVYFLCCRYLSMGKLQAIFATLVLTALWMLARWSWSQQSTKNKDTQL
jgi:hypothetical protein